MEYDDLRTVAEDYLSADESLELYSTRLGKASEPLHDNPDMTADMIDTLLEGSNVASTLDSNKAAIGILAAAMGISALSAYDSEYDFEK